MNEEEQLKADEMRLNTMSTLAECLQEKEPFVLLTKKGITQRDLQTAKALIIKAYALLLTYESDSILK